MAAPLTSLGGDRRLHGNADRCHSEMDGWKPICDEIDMRYVVLYRTETIGFEIKKENLMTENGVEFLVLKI